MPHPARTLLLAVLLAPFLLAPCLRAQDFSHPNSAPAPQTPVIQKANDALASGDFSTALKILTSLNTQLPNNPQILYDLGLALEALGEINPPETNPSENPAETIPAHSNSLPDTCTTPAAPTASSSSNKEQSTTTPPPPHRRVLLSRRHRR